MDNFTVYHGKVYRAKLQLNFFESMASNDQIAEKFHEMGFRHITVSGSGSHRWAQGTWNGPDKSVPLTDEHVEFVEEVKAPKAAKEESVDPHYVANPYGPDTGIVPPSLQKKIEDEKLGQHNPFNPAYPDANDNVTGGG